MFLPSEDMATEVQLLSMLVDDQDWAETCPTAAKRTQIAATNRACPKAPRLGTFVATFVAAFVET
jgi:hypothetical protein